MPLITVVIPVYKVEMYLERCIESILSQDFHDLEIILVDDGSPDNCGMICDEYARKHANIKTIHKRNAGLGYARNTGIEIATGQYIMFVDSDDYIERNLISDLVNAAIKENADTVIAGYSRRIGDVVSEIKNPIAGKCFRGNNVVSSVLYKMIGPIGNGSDSINMAAWRVLYSLDIIKKYNVRYPSEREYISEDIIFDLYYYQHSGCVVGIENCGYVYCMNPGSLTERYNPDRYVKGEVLYKEKKRILKLFSCWESESEYRTVESFLRYSRYAIKSEVKFAATNGTKSAIGNINKIISSSEYIKAIVEHENNDKSRVDRIIDYLALKKKAVAIYCVLKLGYIIRGKNDKV